MSQPSAKGKHKPMTPTTKGCYDSSQGEICAKETLGQKNNSVFTLNPSIIGPTQFKTLNNESQEEDIDFAFTVQGIVEMHKSEGLAEQNLS